MVFFELNKRWKLYIYWVGVGGSFLSLFGIILIIIWFNMNWRDNIFKVKRKGDKLIIIDKELKGIEKFFFLWGFPVTLFLIMLVIDLIQMMFTGSPM